MTMLEELQEAGPWISKFTVGEFSSGGWFDVFNDMRASNWLDMLPEGLRVAECGSLEGGHTAIIARHKNVKEVVGFEGRDANLNKCRLLHKYLGIENSSFIKLDLDSESHFAHGGFDATFCSGVLYHFVRPDLFIEKLKSKHVFLGTHYSHENIEMFNGMAGRWYEEQGLSDVLSGLSPKSFWLTLESLASIITRCGYLIEQIDASDHKNGPWVNLILVRR